MQRYVEDGVQYSIDTHEIYTRYFLELYGISELDGEDIMRIIMKKESNQEGDCGIRACQLANIIIIIRSLIIIISLSPLSCASLF